MNASYFEELQLGFYGIGNDGKDTDVGSIYPHPPAKAPGFHIPISCM